MTDTSNELLSEASTTYFWQRALLLLGLVDNKSSNTLNTAFTLLTVLAVTCYILTPNNPRKTNERIRQLPYKDILMPRNTYYTSTTLYSLLTINILYTILTFNFNDNQTNSDTPRGEHITNVNLQILTPFINTFLMGNLLLLAEKIRPPRKTINLENSPDFWVWAEQKGNLNSLTNTQVKALSRETLEKIVTNPEKRPHDNRFKEAYSSR